MMTGFDLEQDADQPAYRPVSTLAVLALVAGGLSALALSTQVLWVVPLLAVGLAVAAIRDTAAGTPPKAGRGVALAGLALAVGFGCQAVGFAAADHWIGRARAIAVATSWREAIQAGRWAEARDFCAPAALPATGDPFGAGPQAPHDHADGHDHDHDHDHADADDSPQLAAFRAIPAVAAVAGCSGVAVTDCQPDDEQAPGSWRVTLALNTCDSSTGTDLPAEVTLWLFPELQQVPRLTPGATGTQRVERWRIIRFDPAD